MDLVFHRSQKVLTPSSLRLHQSHELSRLLRLAQIIRVRCLDIGFKSKGLLTNYETRVPSLRELPTYLGHGDTQSAILQYLEADNEYKPKAAIEDTSNVY